MPHYTKEMTTQELAKFYARDNDLQNIPAESFAPPAPFSKPHYTIHVIDLSNGDIFYYVVVAHKLYLRAHYKNFATKKQLSAVKKRIKFEASLIQS